MSIKHIKPYIEINQDKNQMRNLWEIMYYFDYIYIMIVLITLVILITVCILLSFKFRKTPAMLLAQL